MPEPARRLGWIVHDPMAHGIVSNFFPYRLVIPNTFCIQLKNGMRVFGFHLMDAVISNME